MPRQDIFHESVKKALVKDGLTITPDPYTLPFDTTNLYVDLEGALGRFVLYRALLKREEPDQALYLAISRAT